jgi:hypothetical protein
MFQQEGFYVSFTIISVHFVFVSKRRKIHLGHCTVRVRLQKNTSNRPTVMFVTVYPTVLAVAITKVRNTHSFPPLSEVNLCLVSVLCKDNREP